MIAILIIALVVVIVGAAVIYGRALVKQGRDRMLLHRRRVEDAEREERMGEAWQNVLKKPKDGIDWERRYAELVEDVSRRTDQAKGMATANQVHFPGSK